MIKKHNSEKQRSMTYGTVLTVDFPYSDSMGFKVRPAVIVSGERFNDVPWRYKGIVIAFITSKKPFEFNDWHIEVRENCKSFKSSGLLAKSYIRLDKLYYIDERKVKKFIGRFSLEFMKERKISELCSSIFSL